MTDFSQASPHSPTQGTVAATLNNIQGTPPTLIEVTPSPTCCPPNEVVIHLSTTLVVSDYNAFYPLPINQFRPAFQSLPDGSLVTPPFVNDLAGANYNLLVTGMLAMLFARNIAVSGNYLWRGRMNNKTLFRMLFLSQILASVSLIPIILSHFVQKFNCSAIILISSITASMSLALLITGILGLKAYKCLEDSKFVLVILVIFQCASTATVALDAFFLRGARRLTGGCIRISNLLFTRIFVMIQLAESLFICCCFMYTCWKIRNSISAHSRLSLHLSMEDLSVSGPRHDLSVKHYPEDHVDFPPTSTNELVNSGEVIGDQCAPPPRTSTVRIFENQSSGKHECLIPRGRNSPTPSSFSRFSRIFSRLELFQQAMKDELFYTTFITASCVVVAILAVIGVNFKNGLTVSSWFGLNWAVISLFAIHSLGRAVHRHEREAIIQRYCSTFVYRGLSAKYRQRRQWSLSSIPSFQSRTCAEPANNVICRDESNPFSDVHHLGQLYESWSSSVNTRSMLSNSLSPSPMVAIDGHEAIPDRAKSPSSTLDSSFPISGRDTPLVTHQSSTGSLLRGFTQSWLESSSTSDSSTHSYIGNGEGTG